MKSEEVTAAVEHIENAWATRRKSFSAAPADAKTMLEEARRELGEAVSLCRRIGAERELGRALHKLGHIEKDLRNPARARELYEEALALARRRGDSLAVAHDVRHLGDMDLAEGRPAEAEARYTEALRLYQSHQEPPALDFANAVSRLAGLKEDTGPVDETRRLLEQAADLYRAAGVPEGVADCTQRLARLSSTGSSRLSD